MEVMIRKGKIIILFLILISGGYMSLFAQISSTAQKLDGFSFKKGLSIGGGLTLSNEFFMGSDSLVLRDPYAFYLNGNLNINLWGIDMPFSFSLSNTERSFTQPFNRFRLNPSYKWARLILGTSNLNYSKYTLAGHDINGVGFELTPGKWYVSAIYGRLKKAVEYDPNENNFRSISFRRIGYAAKVGYKSKSGSYDLSFFHGEDDKNSLIGYIPPEAIINPKKNTAVSANIRQTFLKNFFISGEYAFSLYDQNIFDTDGRCVNTSSFLDKMFDFDDENRFVDAVNFSFGYQSKIWGLSLRYERISPYYSSLGGYYFNDDMVNYTIAPNFRLLKGKLNFSGNFGLQMDNLDNQRSSDNKRLVYSANLAYSSGKIWSAGISFSNFKTHTRVKPISYPFVQDDLDSLNFYQVSRALSAYSSFMFGENNSPHSISFSASYQTANSLTGDWVDSYSNFFNSNLAYSKIYNLLKFNWSAILNFNSNDNSGINTIYFGPSLIAQKSFFKEKFSTSFSFTSNLNKVDNRDMGGLIFTSLSLDYTIKAKNEKFGTHTFSLNSGYSRYLGSMQSVPNQYEFLTKVTYRTNF